MSWLRRLALTMFFVAHNLASSARADDPEPRMQAREAYERATRAYDSERLVLALRGFESSYRLVPRARTLWNIVVTLRRLGRNVDAANALARYVVAIDTDPRRAEQAANWLALLDAGLARVERPHSGPFSVDDVLVELPPEVAHVRVAPGVRRLSHAGQAWKLRVESGRTYAGSPPRPPLATAITKPRRWPIAATIAVVAITATGTTGWLTMRTERELREVRQDAPDDAARVQQLRMRGHRYALATNVGIGVSALAVVATGYFWWSDRAAAPPAVPIVSVGDAHAVVGVELAF